MTFWAVQMVWIAALVLVGIVDKLPESTGNASALLVTQQSPAPGDVPRSVWEGVYTEEQAKRGQAVHLDECARCHSETLAGGDFGPPLIGDAFLAAWSGQSAGDLFERIRLSMPQDSPGRLSRQQYADVLTYIFQANQFPAGHEALKPDLTALTPIKIEAKKAG